MKKILVTGASSFLGHHVMPLLEKYAVAVEPTWPGGGRGISINPRFQILAPSSKELNLLNRDSVISYIKKHKPDTILHMAALCGGIGANKKRPGDFILHNTKMATNLFDAISEVNFWDNPSMTRQVVTHFYGLGSVCGYPKNCPVPFKEEDLWNGFPEETNAPYGTAKRHMIVMQDAYRLQHGLRGAHLIPVNLYGEYDHFNLDNSHVMPALINKFIAAKQNGDESVEVWGDGTPTREFLYAGDCAEAIVRAVVTGFDYPIPVNIGTGHDISIKDLADLIKEVVGFDGEIRFTGEVSVNGQPKRRLDVSRARDILGFTAETDLRAGLEKTVNWYKESKSNPVKEAMNTGNTEKASAEALAKLNRVISLLEKNTEEVFEQIRQNPQNAKNATLNRYLGLLTVALDRAHSLNKGITSPILESPGPSVFIKATPIKDRTARMQALVKEIRDAIGDPELLKSIAERVDSIKPNLGTITEENKEFLLGLISRAQRTKETINVSGDVFKNKEFFQTYIKSVADTDKLIQAEGAKLSKEVEVAREKLQELEARRERFFNNLKRIDPKTGEVKVLDYTADEFLHKKFPISQIKLPNKEELQKKVDDSKDHHSGVGGYTGETSSRYIGYEYSKSKELKKFNESRNHKGFHNPVDLLVRAGLDRSVAEQRVRDGLGREVDNSKILKALGIPTSAPVTTVEKITSTDPVQQEQLRELAKKINAVTVDTEKPKHNVVRRLDSDGTNVNFPKKPSISESLKAVEQVYQRTVRDDIAEAKAPPKPERTLGFYEAAEKLKREKASKAIIGKEPGFVRRTDCTEVPNDAKPGKFARPLSYHEKEFFEAASAFAKDYGISTSELVRYRRGKRLPTDNFLNTAGLTDTEIMAAKFVSGDIKIPNSKLDDHHIACPRRVDSNTKPQETKPQVLNTQPKKKVEKKEKKTLFGTAKKLVSSIVDILKS